MEAIRFISYIYGRKIASINLTIIQQQLIGRALLLEYVMGLGPLVLGFA